MRLDSLTWPVMLLSLSPPRERERERERERVRRFIEGLIQPIRLQMAKETGSEISFQDAANVAWRVEMVLSQEGGQGSNKRPHNLGRFSGASSRGKDSFCRGHPPMPFHLVHQVSHGAPGGRGSRI